MHQLLRCSSRGRKHLWLNFKLPRKLFLSFYSSYPFHSSSSLDTMKHSVLSYEKQNTYPYTSPSLVVRLALHSYYLNLFLCSLLPNQQEQDSHHHSCVALLIEIPLESPPSWNNPRVYPMAWWSHSRLSLWYLCLSLSPQMAANSSWNCVMLVK